MQKIIKTLVVVLVLLIAIPVAFFLLSPNRIIAKSVAKEELRTSASQFMNWRGAELHYTDEGSGFPVMMIHGFGGSYHNFKPLADIMKKQYRVICVDLPGFGLSDFPAVKEGENYLQDYRDYISFFMDTMHLDSVYVIGNSMGGAVTWMSAIDHPDKVKKIVLLNPAGYDSEEISGKLAMFKFKSVRQVFEKGMPLFMSEQGLSKVYYNDSLASKQTALINNKFTNREGNITHMLNLALAKQFPDTAYIKQVHCPTLVVWGNEDEIIPVAHAQRFQRDIQGSELLIFEKCGHCPMMEMPEETAQAAHQFLQKQP